MPTVFVRHKVRDYDAWRPIYDGTIGMRQEADLRDLGVFRDAEDPNMILMMWETDNLDGFNAMLGSPDLKAVMEDAGVISEPKAWIAG